MKSIRANITDNKNIKNDESSFSPRSLLIIINPTILTNVPATRNTIIVKIPSSSTKK